MYIYSSIIQPKIDDGISIWGYTTAHNINKVQRLQNRAAIMLTGNFDYVNTRGIDYLLLLNACVRVADVMTFRFVSLMPVHNVCRICIIIKE